MISNRHKICNEIVCFPLWHTDQIMSYGELNIDLVEYSTRLKNNPLVEYSITIALHDQ